MKKILAALFAFCVSLGALSALQFTPELEGSFLWKGGVSTDAALSNRLDASLSYTGKNAWLDFTSRALLLDDRSFTDNDKTLTMLGAALYHGATGSALLYGALDVAGLPSRVKHIYLHGAPWVASHNKFSVDLKTETAKDARAAFAAYFASPSFTLGFAKDIKPFLAVIASEKDSALDFLAGGGAALPFKTQVRAEFYARKHSMAERDAGGWFSEKTRLPEREGVIAGGSLFALSPLWGASFDGVISDVFAYGRGYYYNAALQLGNKPWRFSVAFDQIGSRFTDAAGAMPETGYRLGLKVERFMARGEKWRAETFLRGFDSSPETFSRSLSKFYYYFPQYNKKPFNFTRAFVSANRNADKPSKIIDKWDAGVSMRLFKFHFATSLSLDEYTHDETPSPLPDPSSVYTINGWGAAQEASVTQGKWTFSAKLAVDNKLDAGSAEWKAPEWKPAFSAKYRFAHGYVTAKAADALKIDIRVNF